MRKSNKLQLSFGVLVMLVGLIAFTPNVSAQNRRGGLGGWGDKISNFINVKVSDVTLEAIDFRDQTARLSVGLDITNPYVPVKLKDFDYRLSLFDQATIEGRHDGTLSLGGRNGSHVDLPVTINLRSLSG